MKNFICCGMQYGDEGKGSYIDWLAWHANAGYIVKYNGGSQASHTVESGGVTHRFAQLGSGMFNGAHTCITKDVIVNPDNMLREISLFAKENKETEGAVLKRIHIHKDCLIVTPYHRLMGRLRELSLGEGRRGSVGTGNSETAVLWGIKILPGRGLGLTIGELYNGGPDVIRQALKDLYDYANGFFEKYKNEIIRNCPDGVSDEVSAMVNGLLGKDKYIEVAEKMNSFHAGAGFNLKGCLYSDFNELPGFYDATVIWEGSHGFLIDKDFGIAPNTTKLSTTNRNAVSYAEGYPVKKLGITKAFCSRHGRGVFVTEDEALKGHIADNNQCVSFWNGEPRYGWFDAVMFRYSQSVNKADYVCLSCIDQLAGLKEVKICEEYHYNGEIDGEFDSVFEHEGRSVTGIKKSHPGLKGWLLQCVPVYKVVPGWEDSFDNTCVAYIERLQKLMGVEIAVVSKGPTKKEKLVLAPALYKW